MVAVEVEVLGECSVPIVAHLSNAGMRGVRICELKLGDISAKEYEDRALKFMALVPTLRLVFLSYLLSK